MSDFKRYNDGGFPDNTGVQSTIGDQIVEEAYERKAIVDAARDMYFMPLAETKDMPRNSGKTMKSNIYYPILDVRNVADEGIDALGQTFDAARFYAFVDGAIGSVGWLQGGGGLGDADATGGFNSVEAVVDSANYAAWIAANPTGIVSGGTSNMYGGSRDPGVITAKLPLLSEGAQRVNRVGSTRVVTKGSIEQFGFFTEYTEDSMMFDTDAELMMHITTEMIHAAVEVTEDLLQRDLLTCAATIRLAGGALTKATLEATDIVTYDDFVNLSIELDLNRTPKQKSVITGSRMVDTKTINSARIMYVAAEMIPLLESLQDYQGGKAMTEVRQYEGQTTTLNGEHGSIHSFRIVVNPEMQYESGGGAAEGQSAVYNNNTNNSVFPMLVVGDDSFSTIGFMSDGKKRNTKFTIHHLKPGADSLTRENPYANMGLMSIRWWYGFLCKRPERIAVMWTTVPISITP